ncbi:hypothetical protein AM455_04430 [Klebsiella pneumoniae]|nr:hypothetical protein AM455_04430 [Klebsiella pneumoniae]
MRDLILQLSKSSIYSTKPRVASNSITAALISGGYHSSPYAMASSRSLLISLFIACLRGVLQHCSINFLVVNDE